MTIKNILGTSEIVGMEVAARAKPDVFTKLFASSTSMGINVPVSKALPYDSVRDCGPVAIGDPV